MGSLILVKDDQGQDVVAEIVEVIEYKGDGLYLVDCIVEENKKKIRREFNIDKDTIIGVRYPTSARLTDDST